MRALTVGNMYPPHSLGGYEQVWRGAVRDLRARGHEVRVLTTDYRDPRPDPRIDEDDDVHRELRWYWRDHEFPRIRISERLRVERHNLELLDRHVGELRPDVIAWWAMGGMSMSLVERVRRRELPAVGFVLDAWMLYGPKVDAWHRAARRAGPLRGALERATRVPVRVDLGAAARWVFISETMRSQALAEHALSDTGVAHAGIDTARFTPAPPKPWGWRLLYAGRLDERKGVHVAVRALAELPEATLTIDGGGDSAYAQRLESLVEELGLASRVAFTRLSSQELPGAYAAADAVVFPVLWDEPWGLVPLEAMAVGTPVIATGAGGSGEYLRDGDNCLLYAPRDDAGALAGAARRLAGDEALRQRLRERGLETVPAHTAERFNAAVADELEAAAGR